MTDKTDIAALREAAMKATAGEWCTDSQHSVIADAGLNANYYVAECSGPDSKTNAKFIALANPATILAILDQLEAVQGQLNYRNKVLTRAIITREAAEAKFEAERQRAGELQSTINRLSKESNKLFDDRQRINKSWTEAETDNALLRDEIAALKGEQVPVAYLYSASFERGEVEGQLTDAPGCDMPVYDRPQKPVVLPKGTGWNSDPYNHGRNVGIKECKAAIEAAGGIVKDGE